MATSSHLHQSFSGHGLCFWSDTVALACLGDQQGVAHSNHRPGLVQGSTLQDAVSERSSECSRAVAGDMEEGGEKSDRHWEAIEECHIK